MMSLAHTLAALKLRTAPVQQVHSNIAKVRAVDWRMLRLDMLDANLSGNKLFKLLPYLHYAKQQNYQTLVSFGGRFSNHLYALAHAGQQFGFNTVGIIQAYAEQAITPTMMDLQSLGMHISLVSKAEYAKRYDASYQAQLSTSYQKALVINEGGAGTLGEAGSQLIAQVIRQSVAHLPDYIVLASGTGTTFLGLCQDKQLATVKIIAVAALCNAASIQQRCQQYSNAYVQDHFHLGGFAKMPQQLVVFIHQFEQQNTIPLDPIYTAKMCFAIEQMIQNGAITAGSSVLSLHTGGLQGRRGMTDKIHQWANCYG